MGRKAAWSTEAGGDRDEARQNVKLLTFRMAPTPGGRARGKVVADGGRSELERGKDAGANDDGTKEGGRSRESSILRGSTLYLTIEVSTRLIATAGGVGEVLRRTVLSDPKNRKLSNFERVPTFSPNLRPEA